MRIFIANHVDAALLEQSDQRAFVQRVFWFLKDYDQVILPAPHDHDFLSYVAKFTGVNVGTLKFHVAGPGKSGNRLFDPETLCDDELIRAVAINSKDITEIFPLWPSAQVAEFASRIGLKHLFSGADFFSQQGDEIANNKGNFRAFSASIGVATCDGAVCRTKSHATATLRRLLERGPVMVKQVHNHAGNGNELVTLTKEEAGHAGSLGYKRLRKASDAGRYFDVRWDWASGENRHPVVVEQFKRGSRTIYAEFMATDSGVSFNATGSLDYAYGRLVAETIPLRQVSNDVHARLVHEGGRLASLYQAFGYRGILSADALLDDDDKLVFTEMNARVGGSYHLYQCIGYQIVDVWRKPERSVVQYVTGRYWKIKDLRTFLDACEEMGIAYDPTSRKGVIVAMPMAGTGENCSFLFCVAYEDEREANLIRKRLENYFSQSLSED